jgi:hypothetical protein
MGLLEHLHFGQNEIRRSVLKVDLDVLDLLPTEASCSRGVSYLEELDFFDLLILPFHALP